MGSQTGVLNIFTYGDWGDISDRFPGHPESVDALVKCDEDIVFTGTLSCATQAHGLETQGVVSKIGSLKCLQSGRAHPLTACGVATLCGSPPTLLETETLTTSVCCCLVAGSSDGLIRVVQILPNKLLGVIGEHMDCPIERMTLSPDRRLLATASHDNSIKLWDVAYVTQV